MTALSRRNSRAYSVLSDDAQSTLPTYRSGTRGVRAKSITFEAAPRIQTGQVSRIPPHYLLPPTVPSPFDGTLEASLDAILKWGTIHACTTPVKEELLRPVRTSTNWPVLLTAAFGPTSGLDSRTRRILLEDLIILVTRTLLPEQIAENRSAMDRLYDRKRQLAIRLVLRYDMVREWCLGEGPVGKRDISVASIPPSNASSYDLVDGPIMKVSSLPKNTGYERRPLMPNILPTLIAAPTGGYPTQGVRERMKHYVTPLDNYLLLSDEEVGEWSDKTLVVRASQIVLQWQWLRQKNETLEDMERGGWEELDGRAEECEWIAEKRDVST